MSIKGDGDRVGDSPTPLGEVAVLFLRLGVTAFGGPAAHIAMMEDEVVRRRGWLTRDEFLDYLGAANLVPGPNSTELAIHLGYARAGRLGLIVAGVAFIVPAALIVTAAAWGYVRYGATPQVAGVLYGIQPVVIAILVVAVWRLGNTAIKSPGLALLGAAAAAAVVSGLHEIWVLALAGGIGGLLRCRSIPRWPALLGVVVAASPAGSAVAAVTPAAAATFGLGTLFVTFAKIGSVLFGSGYVLLAFLRADFVERLGWLTEQQLLDAVAIGQATPGPVFTTATFVGYILAGPAGAAVATIGIFLPAFIFVAVSGPLVPRLRRSVTAGAVLDGVNVASLMLMAVVAAQLGRIALRDLLTVGIAIGSLVLLARSRVNPTWLFAAGGLAGWLAL